MGGDKHWQFWIDRGGTFTDVVALRPDGVIETSKLLSENPEQYEDAAAEGIRRAIDASSHDSGIEAVKMGTTVATNALLERRGTPTALLVTEGFGDALKIGYQNRPDIFALNIIKPAPIHARVIEVQERIKSDGELLVPLDEFGARIALEKGIVDGISSVAICLVHGYRYPEHEERIAELAKELGFEQVSVSHDVEPLIKFVSRAETTLADAYLTPVLNNYIDGLRNALAEVHAPRRLLFMQSNGGLALAEKFRGKDSILSGPAAGVVGMVETATAAGFDKLIGFDMGGTSTDVSAYSGDYERSYDSEVAGVRLRAPMMRIHTIAAGGGSHLRYSDGRYQVGPDSAGANPGPVCYRRGGPLTVTDANVLLGRIPVDFFPSVFGPNADLPLDREAVRSQFEALAAEISADTGTTATPEAVAAGFLTVAVENMANAIRKITIERGEDVRDFTLCCFGGAAGQHACQVAEILGIEAIWLHPMAGVLSAYGMGLANIRVEQQQSIDTVFSYRSLEQLEGPIASLINSCDDMLAAQQVPDDNRRFETRVGLRVAGSDTVLNVEVGSFDQMSDSFHRAYRNRFGATAGSDDLIVATIRVEGTGYEQVFEDPLIESAGPAISGIHNSVWTGSEWQDVPIYERSALGSGAEIDGPAIIVENNSTTVIDSGWAGRVNDRGHLILDRRGRVRSVSDDEGTDANPDPVRLEVFNNLFMHIAEQMGTVLQNTAISVNIRERLDFSCALFDEEGRLVSNAPHMPVHLGSMGESVRTVITARGDDLAPGDSIMLNSPYAGGTHLPDVTIVTPYFADADRPLFFFASRAHHADIGGITPGSMPAESRHIDDEGVLIENFTLVSGGRFRMTEVRELLLGAKYPARDADKNIADMQAQLAANQQGIRQLEKAIARYGLDTVQQYLRFVRENAAASVRRLLGSLTDGSFGYELDSGEYIKVSVAVDQKKRIATVDFTGTSLQSGSNFNAPKAVARAAVLYVFRSLIAEDIPMNEGCLEPLDLVIPDGTLLSPAYPAAVVAGNVETSQCVTDALFGALNALAASQGTMNNLSFGNEVFQYYETIAGGAGAGPGFHGADAVQTHMTNSRLTDPEVLEQTFPVILESFAIRKNSGGRGKWRGGNGAVRKIRFLEPVEASILSNHRRVAPFGLAGGDPGKTGRNIVEYGPTDTEELGSTATVRLGQGARMIIETPGGGGYGREKSGESATE
jgi:5-oxoprolinase (ATP-hydrolysing)